MNTYRLSTVIIGSGNVATHLAKALSSVLAIKQVYSPTPDHANSLANQISVPGIYQAKDIMTSADLYLVAINDDSISSIPNILQDCNPEALYVHTAGSIPLNVWGNFRKRNGVLYPMQTFSKANPVQMSEVPFFIEADSESDVILLEQIIQTVSTKVYRATSEQRSILHLAAVFCCNFSNHLYTLADNLLMEHGLHFESMIPLIQYTAHKISNLSPKEAQTGPAIRLDYTVMNRQLDRLQAYPDLQTIYRIISNSIINYHHDQLRPEKDSRNNF